MIHPVIDPRQLNFLIKLSRLPKNINAYGDRYNVVEFILHELCDHDCLNVNKAAYFVDNHDFDCLHGVAGIDFEEKFLHNDIWQVPDEFTKYMNQLHFNQKVKEVKVSSGKNNEQGSVDCIAGLADCLGMQNVSYSVIPLKHDNHGLFLYETKDHESIQEHDLINGLSLLAFCPLF